MIEVADKTDEELLREYRLEGNPYFLNALFSRYADIGFRTAMRYMRNQSDAEDVLQLAFIQFLQNMHFFREGASTVKPWLLKMIVNTSINKLKEEKRRLTRQRHVASERFLQNEKNEQKIEKQTEADELKNKIKTFVDTLPEKYRSPIWLVLYEGCTYPEVATVLALPEKTVRTQVARGLEKLREIFGTAGSVLSIDMIVGLIAASRLDVAPFSVKQIIDSPELYRSVSSKAVSTSSKSGKIAMSSNSSIFSTKIIFTTLAIALAIIGGIYSLKKTESSSISMERNQTNLPLSKVNKLDSKDTNQTWDFNNINDRKLPLLMGKWDWAPEFSGMMSPNDTAVMISLPISIQEKPFVIECLVVPTASRENPNLKLTMTMMPYWAKGNLLLQNEKFINYKTFRLKGNAPIQVRTYFYQNYICNFQNGNMSVEVQRYSQDLLGANVVLLSKNYVYKKVTSRTLEAPPDELIKAIENISKQTGYIQKDWVIDETKFSFKK